MTEQLNESGVTKDNKCKPQNRILCHNYGRDCLNNAVGECDMGDGRGVKFYCRSCMTYCGELDVEDMEIDESLVFCSREWELQA